MSARSCSDARSASSSSATARFPTLPARCLFAHSVVPPLKLKVEHGKDIREGDLPELEREIQEKMHKDVKVRPAISWLEPDTLERATKKTQLLEKHYDTK